jgi:hypothetical protein
MTSSVDSLTGMPLPALVSSPSVATRPNASSAAAAAAAGSADDTGAVTSTTAGTTAGAGGMSFDKLMHLQSRGRALEVKLQPQTSGAAGDPAVHARHAQADATREQFHALRELVGDAPGGNARRAFAAIVERLESGGSLQPGDRARIRLAIAADQHKVDLKAAMRAKSAILSFEDAIDKISSQAADPTLVQDPARLAIFQAQGKHQRDGMLQLEQLIQSGTLDQHSIDEAFKA